MPERKPSLTVYVDQPLKQDIEEIRKHLSESGVTYKTTQVAEFALRELVKRYRSDGDQFKLDFGPKL